MKIEDVELTDLYKGKIVQYYPDGFRKEKSMMTGILTNWDQYCAYVKFPLSEISHKCMPDKLKWRK